MAPRGRSRKSRNTRMDAALDALGPMGMGFPENSVRQTVKELLKVYGGDDGWPFIEENGYKVLLDALLEKQQSGSPNKDVLQDDARSLIDIEPSAAGSSCGVTTPICSEIEVVNPKLPADAALNSISQSSKALEFEVITPACSEIEVVNNKLPADAAFNSISQSIKALDIEITTPTCSDPDVVNTKLPTAAALISQSTKALEFEAQTNDAGARDCNTPLSKEERRGDCKDDKLDINLCTKKVDDVQDFEPDGHIGRVKDSGKDTHLANTPTLKLEGFISTRKRRPYHGWISSDDNYDDSDLVDLTPIPLPEGWEKFFRQIHAKKKRKTRWDVRPKDV